ncbi:MAG TPA: GlsB/YeaQ/YmgE family stress response membrane protein [Streptosporangiaceae bacterium]|nr:GlsB/YeaQ/YmgE family stress response membrane protein [Streptosporangiaceae bacterium]
MNRRMRGPGPCGNLGETEFKVRVSEQQRKDLGLLPGAQDRQERWCRLSVHYWKNALQFADTGPGDCLIGVAGALGGGWLATKLFHIHSLQGFFNLSTWLTAIAGAAVLLLVFHLVSGRSHRFAHR